MTRRRPSGSRKRLAVAAAGLWILASVATGLGGVAAPGWTQPALGATLLAVDDAYTVIHDRKLVVAAPGVLANDIGLGEGSTAVRDAGPSHGALSLAEDGGFVYKPDARYVGSDSFTYHTQGGLLNSNTATVTILITNVAPVTTVDAYTGTSGQALVVAAPGVLANDVDADGDKLTAKLEGGVSNGSLQLSSDGGFVYDGGNFSGITSFEYRAWDGVAFSLVTTVTITMVEPQPTATPTLPLPTPTLPLPTPTLPLPTPTPTPTPRPNSTPTPTPSPTPSPTASPTPAPTRTPAPTPSPDRPIASPSPLVGGPGPAATPSSSDRPFALPEARFDPFDDRFTGVAGLVGIEWAVPGVILAVPGLLVILAVLAQAAIGVVWLPVVRRQLAGVGLRRQPRPRRPARP